MNDELVNQMLGDQNNSPTAVLLAEEIERFLRKTGTAASAFGAQALDDPNLVTDLRGGREFRHPNIGRFGPS